MIPHEDIRLTSYAERRAAHMFKLTMILSAARSDKMIVDREDILVGEALLEEVEEDMIHVFSGIGSNPYAAIQNQIVRVLEVRKEITHMDLLKLFRSDIQKDQLAKILDSLSTMGICKEYMGKGLTKIIYTGKES